jgi:hypothetical protein
MVHINFTRLRFLSRRRQRPCASHLRSLLQDFGARDVNPKTVPPASKPSTIICRTLIPIFDGLELAQMIRQAGANANPYVPIIPLGEKPRRRPRDAGITVSSPSRFSPRHSMSAFSTSSPTRARSSRPRRISGPIGAARQPELCRGGTAPRSKTANGPSQG